MNRALILVHSPKRPVLRLRHSRRLALGPTRSSTEPFGGTVTATSPESPHRATFRQVLAVPEFRALYAARLLSLVGDQMTRIALAVAVYSQSKSPLLSAATFASAFLPYLVAGPVLATLGDRFPRRQVMVVCDLLRAGSAGRPCHPRHADPGAVRAAARRGGAVRPVRGLAGRVDAGGAAGRPLRRRHRAQPDRQPPHRCHRSGHRWCRRGGAAPVRRPADGLDDLRALRRAADRFRTQRLGRRAAASPDTAAACSPTSAKVPWWSCAARCCARWC